MDNDEQLKDLIAKAEQISFDIKSDPASRVNELAQIVAELADIVHAHIYRNDDPGQA